MRRFPTIAALLVVGACSDLGQTITGPTHVPSAAAPAVQVPAFQPGVVVVRFTPGAAAAEIAGAEGATVSRTLPQDIRVLRVPLGRERTVVAALSRNPDVLFAELSVPRTLGIPCAAADGDCVAPSDLLFGRRWDLHNDGTVRDAAGNVLASAGLVPDADMDWLEAFDRLGAFTGAVTVGVVDTGIFPGHEDLTGRLLVQRDFFNIDQIAEDDHGHGTHVSGIVMAHAHNAKGAAGIAYGPNVRLAVAKGCGETIIGYICWSPDIADGIMWLADQGASVINLSLGGQEPSSAEQTALQYAVARNALPVCAAGNDRAAVDWPAAFPECMAVSATGWDDRRASYSSAGPEVDVAAPGGDTIHAAAYDMIVSTFNNGGYVYMAGTSMATPQVTGLAALLHALGVTTLAGKRSVITATADDLGTAGFDWLYGNGRINVLAAVEAVIGEPPPPPPTNDPPVASFTSACTGLDCSFTDGSTDDAGVVSWQWNFGDGVASPVASPSHSYAAAGTYAVTLVVTDAGALADTATQQVTVTAPPPPPPNEPPVASFTLTCAHLACSFTDTSTDDDGVVAWLWDFGDGAISDQRNPTHTYAAAGTYTVGLLVEDADSELDLAIQEVTVTAPPPPPPNEPPTASFTFACALLACSFTDTSTDDVGVAGWLWDFGDGYGSTLQNPTHTYAAGGTYTVELQVEGADGELETATQDVTVVEPPPVLSASGLKIKGENVVDLTWSGTTKPVDLYRDGVLIVAAKSSTPPTHRDMTGRKGKATFVYRACLAGTTNCSSDVTVVF